MFWSRLGANASNAEFYIHFYSLISWLQGIPFPVKALSALA